MKRLFDLLARIFNTIKNYVLPRAALPADTEVRARVVQSPTYVANEKLPGDKVLHTSDVLVGCNIGGDLTLEGNNILVEDCRVNGDIRFVARTRDCRVNRNAVYGDIVFEGLEDYKHNEWENNTLVRRPKNDEGKQQG